jgi:Zn-dependent peptidase ImmA (M78 family)
MAMIDAKVDWEKERHRQFLAGRVADDLIVRLGYKGQIDPHKIIASESEWLRAGGRNFKNSFDGKLKYYPQHQRFVLFYNTKYDVDYTNGPHHPRTRFSIAHELGHYFLEEHRDYLLNGGITHPSKSEFRRQNRRIEREADAFAASLLLPTSLVGRRVNQSRPTLELVDELSRDYQVSPVCATFRIVRLSEDPCAVAGIRNGEVAWMFPSDRLIAGSCYPRKGELESEFAIEQWNAFVDGDSAKVSRKGLAAEWLSLFGRAANIEGLEVKEHYLPVKFMNTVIVLITMDDNELFGGGTSPDGRLDLDEDDEYDSPWTKDRHDSGD